MSSRDLFAAFMDLLVNIKDFLVIFDPTNGISINNHLLLPINSPHGEEVGDFWPLTYLLTWLVLSSLYLISCLFGGKTPTDGRVQKEAPKGYIFKALHSVTVELEEDVGPIVKKQASCCMLQWMINLASMLSTSVGSYIE